MICFVLRQLFHRHVIYVLACAGLAACGGGGGNSGGGGRQGVLHTSLSAGASDILASQIASGTADRLSAFLLNTDSPAITRLTGRAALDSFLAKHPVDRFEMLSAGRNPHVMLAWLAGNEGVLDIGPGFIIPPDQSPDSSIAPNGRFFLWGMPTPPELVGQATASQIDFQIDSFWKCSGCAEHSFQMAGQITLLPDIQRADIALATDDTAPRPVSLSAQLDMQNGQLAASDRLPVLAISGQDELVTGWTARASLFGEQAEALAGVMSLHTSKHHLTGAIVSTAPDINPR